MRTMSNWAGPLAATLSFILILGCEEMVDPAGTTGRAFTMYGLFNPRADTQAARVFTIDDLLETTNPEPIDARVLATHVETGIEMEWQDSLIQFPGGLWGHVFFAPFDVEYENSYRLQVLRSDGVSASAITTVPPETQAVVTEPDTLQFDLITTLFWPRAPSVINVWIEYLSNVGIFIADYGARPVAVPGGRALDVRFRADTRIILFEARRSNVPDVYVTGVVIRAVVASDDWVPPGGVFDPDVLVEPGTFTNVDNGFGFVGSGYETATLWVPSDGMLRAAGFDVPEPE